MKLFRVKSTSIEALGYDPIQGIAGVLFLSSDGKTRQLLYQFYDVSPTLWEQIIGADSIGSAVQRLLVKTRLTFEKVSYDPKDIQSGPMPDLTASPTASAPRVTLRQYFDSFSVLSAWC